MSASELRASGSSSSASTSRSSQCTSPACWGCRAGSTRIRRSHGLGRAEPSLDDRCLRARLRDPRDHREHCLVHCASAPPAGDDPWNANTLEWSTTSPPPPYNFATIPVVRSADPNWDATTARRTAEAGARRARPRGRARDGRRRPRSTGTSSEVLRMPEDSPWPLLLAVALDGLLRRLDQQLERRRRRRCRRRGDRTRRLAFPWTRREEVLA